MAYTYADLQYVEDCIKSCVLETQLPNGQRIRYHRLDELQALRMRIMAELGLTSPSTSYGRVININCGHGL